MDWRIEATKDGKTSFLPRTFDSLAAAVRHAHYQMIYADFANLAIIPAPGHAVELIVEHGGVGRA